jgi:hypothetical protein
MLTFYKKQRAAPALLELAIWKSKLTEHIGQNNDSVSSRT